jgi:hypothetical protein
MLPDILETISQSRANDLACLLGSMGMDPQSPPSRPLVTHMMHPSRLHDLRTFLKNDSASFKDPQQALALELIRGKEPSLLVIGPTGMGCFHILYAHPFNNHSSQGLGKTPDFHEYWNV